MNRPPAPVPLPSGNTMLSSLLAVGGTRNKPLWPPRFETHGASYVFQPQSGCFFEPLSEYYYCPKSRLYYCSNKGIYYRSVGPPPTSVLGDETGYLRFDPPIPMGADDSSSSTLDMPNSSQNQINNDNLNSRKPVTMSISFGNTKAKSSTKKKDITNTVTTTNPELTVSSGSGIGTTTTSSITAFRKGAVNQAITKWEEVKKKDMGEDMPLSTTTSTDNTTPATTNTNNDNINDINTAIIINKTSTIQSETPSSATTRSSNNIITSHPDDQSSIAASISATATSTSSSTSTSAQVCLLCRRQFANTEQLQRHEKESKLHAENLAKKLQNETKSQLQSQSSVTTTTAAAAEIVYRDRASERRATHGQSLNPEPLFKRRSSRSRSRSRERPRDTDRDRERMMRRMDTDKDRDRHSDRRNSGGGSSKGDIAGSVTAVFEDASNPGNQMLRKLGWQEGRGLGKDGSGVRDPVSLKSQDSNVKTGVGSTMTSSIPPIEYGEGRVYKDSLLRAAKARYDQIDNQQ